MSAGPHFPKPRAAGAAAGASTYRSPAKVIPVEEAAPEVVMVQRAEPPPALPATSPRPKEKAPRKPSRKLTPEEIQALLLSTKGAVSPEPRVIPWSAARLMVVPILLAIGALEGTVPWWSAVAFVAIGIALVVREARRT